MSDLIDTTEMYLRTIYELQEEGIAPLRARIAERLDQSGPTVSQTVARMERDGLLVLQEDRHLELTPVGHRQAVRVMRKHRLAERLLVDVIGMDWESVHDEACRWEHVMSEEAERRLLVLLGRPTESPFGNPIPGLDELEAGAGARTREHGSDSGSTPDQAPDGVTLGAVAGPGPSQHVVLRITEALQEQPGVLSALRYAGVQPGSTISVTRSGPDALRVVAQGVPATLTHAQADLVIVRRAPAS